MYNSYPLAMWYNNKWYLVTLIARNFPRLCGKFQSSHRSFRWMLRIKHYVLRTIEVLVFTRKHDRLEYVYLSICDQINCKRSFIPCEVVLSAYFNSMSYIFCFEQNLCAFTVFNYLLGFSLSSLCNRIFWFYLRMESYCDIF